MADVIHMPCGCPYPGLGDTVPCPHGNYPPGAWILDDDPGDQPQPASADE